MGSTSKLSFKDAYDAMQRGGCTLEYRIDGVYRIELDGMRIGWVGYDTARKLRERPDVIKLVSESYREAWYIPHN